MIDEEILYDIINDFTEKPKHKFSIKNFKYFMGPENQETLFVTLQVEEKITDEKLILLISKLNIQLIYKMIIINRFKCKIVNLFCLFFLSILPVSFHSRRSITRHIMRGREGK